MCQNVRPYHQSWEKDSKMSSIIWPKKHLKGQEGNEDCNAMVNNWTQSHLGKKAKPIWLKLAVFLPDLWRQLLLSSWAWSSLNSPVELGSLHPLRRTIQQRDEDWWNQIFLQVIDVIITLPQLNLPLRLLLEHPHLGSIVLHPPTNLLQNHSVLVQGSARTARWNQGNPQGNLHHNSILIRYSTCWSS